MAQTLNKYLINLAPQVDLNYLPERLRSKLLPFQVEGLNFAVSKDGRCLIADEMGLGKTLQAIAVACFYKDEWPLLIMLPASLKYQWVEELEKWLPELLPSDINMINSSSDVGNISKCKINIVAYSLLRYGNPNTSVLLKAIRAQQFKVSICDESHNIRNKNTRTANVVVDLIKNSVRCILLSGTPALNKPSELFTQIDSILPGRFGTFTEYTLKYCNARYVYYGRSKVWNVDGATNLDELELKLKQFIMIRRLKKEVLRQLPPKRRQKVPFDLKFDSNSSELQKEITAMQEELERLLNSSGSTVAEVIQPTQGGPVLPVVYEIRSLISQLYTKTCQAKVGPVVEFVLFYTSGEDSNKVLVFAHHHAMMNSIQESLWNANIKHIRIDGTVPTNERNLLVKQFQSDPQTKVAILSILAAGSGLTLTAASAVVFAELYWTPAILMQCEDRAHRIGQTAQSVNIYYLVARGTIDERVWSMVEKKTRVLAMALDGQKKGLSAVNSNKHVSGILSAADVKTPVDADNAVEVDINVEDFFTLADLKGQNQPTLSDFLSQSSNLRTIPRKRRKQLVLRPPEVVDIINNDDGSIDRVSINKKAKLNDGEFMSWALGDNEGAKPLSPSSLPSLSSSPARSSDNDCADMDNSDKETVDVKDNDKNVVHIIDADKDPIEVIEANKEAVDLKDTGEDTVDRSPLCKDIESGNHTAECSNNPTESVAQGSDSCNPNSAPTQDCQQKPVPIESSSNNSTSFTKIQENDAYSPVNLPAFSKGDISEASFNILPGKAGCCSGSELSGNLFSDASFEDEMFDDSPQHQTQGLSTVDKAEEAKLAAELLCDDEVEDEENGEYWTCICRAVNDRELDCCLKCKLPRMPTTWTCRSCLTLNRLADTHCDECLAERDTGADDPGEGERVVDISAIPVYPKFYFLVSHHTTRIFIHDQDKNYLQSSFHTVDLDNPDLLPDILLHPANHKLAKDFVCKWNSLKKREQKVLIKKKEPIDCPEKAYFGGKLTKLRTSNRQRYKSKADIAEEAHRLVESNPGAQTRVIQRPVRDRAANVNESNRPGAGYVQVMSAANKPLCITCHSEYDSDLLNDSVVADEKYGWQTRFCSPECADNFLIKSNTDYIRSTAKSLDSGVCEQCGVNGSELYKRIKCSRSLKERAELIQNSRYASLSAHVKVTMVKDPSEGQFWHVDHILPVYAGGGQCDVDNLRTLCTPCHQVVTSAQAGHRARMRASIGNKTITDFFSPGTKEKLKSYD